jgi:hypothetical protein
MSPVISLLIPCSDFRPEAVYSSLYQRMDATEPLGKAKFPVFFPVNGNFDPETGSQVTASSAIQPLVALDESFSARSSGKLIFVRLNAVTSVR